MKQSKQKITAETKKQIIALRRQGLSYRAIQKQISVQVSFQRIAQILSDEKIENSPHVMEQNKDVVIQMYNNNFSIQFISKSIGGVSKGVIQYWLNKWQITRRDSNNYPPDRPIPKTWEYKEQIIAMYEKGMLLSDIAKEVGLSLKTINSALCKWGISRRRKVISDFQKTEILNAIKQGKSKSEVAKIFNISLSTTYNILRKN